MIRVIAGLGFVAFAWCAAAADNIWPGPAFQAQETVFSRCQSLKTMVDMARAGRETPASAPFGAVAPLSQTHLGATACSSQGEKGKNSVYCTLNGRDEASAAETLRSWNEAATVCFVGWQRRTPSPDTTQYVSPEATSKIVLRKRGTAIQATVSQEACEGVNQMLAVATSGQMSTGGPVFTKEPKRLGMRYYNARQCTGRANDTGDGNTVSCAYAAPTPAAGLQAMNEGLRIGEFCLAKWKAGPVTNGFAFRDPAGEATFTVLKHDERTFDMTMTFKPKAK